jgi:hypothetical protein
VTAVRRTSVLVLAVLLAAASAAADVVITADEVIRCWKVEPAGHDSVRFTLPRWKQRTLSTFDIYEVRLADSKRVAELSTRLPQLDVVLDSRQPIPPAAARAEQLRQHAREASAEDRDDHPAVVEPLALDASATTMMATCWEVRTALLKCGPSDDTVAALLREVRREEEAIRKLWPGVVASIFSGLSLGLVGGVGGFAVGYGHTLNDPIEHPDDYMKGCCAGTIGGSLTGAVIGWALSDGIADGHRKRVNNLVRRTNRAFWSRHDPD